MPSDPEPAEQILEQEDQNADTLARRYAELEMQSPVIKQKRTDNSLCHVVCHAHLAVRNQHTERLA